MSLGFNPNFCWPLAVFVLKKGMKSELDQEEKGREKRQNRRSWAVAMVSACIIFAALSVVQAFSFWGAIVLAAVICLSAVALVRSAQFKA